MKKTLFAILIVLLCFSFADAQQVMIMKKKAAGTDYTVCTNIPSGAVFWYTGNLTGQADDACLTSSTVKDGTESNASFVDSATDPGTASPDSAGNVIKSTHASGYVSWAPASCTVGNCDIINADEGQLQMDVYFAATTGTNAIFRLYYDANNNMAISMDDGNSVVFNAIAAGGTCSIQTAQGAISDTTWTRLCARWSDSNNKIGLAVIATTESCDSATYATACPSGCTTTDADCLGTFGGSPSVFRILNGVANATYVDNVIIKKTSGF